MKKIRVSALKFFHRLRGNALAVFVAAFILLFVLALHCYDRRLFVRARFSEHTTAVHHNTSTKSSLCHANIALATLANGYIDHDLIGQSLDNKKAYAEQWGIRVEILEQQRIAKFAAYGLEIKRAKFAFVESLLRRYSVVFWVDIDAIITRTDVDLCVFLDDMVRQDKYIAMAHDASMDDVLNSGVFLIRRGVGIDAFLSEFARAHSVIEACRSSMTCSSKIYDQNIIAYLTDRWPRCLSCINLWPMAPVHSNAKQFRELFYELPECLFNAASENAHQLSFIIHCYGGGLLDLLSPLSKQKRRGKQACMSRLLT